MDCQWILTWKINTPNGEAAPKDRPPVKGSQCSDIADSELILTAATAARDPHLLVLRMAASRRWPLR